MDERCAMCREPSCAACIYAIRGDMEVDVAGKISNFGGKKAPPIKAGKVPSKGAIKKAK